MNPYFQPNKDFCAGSTEHVVAVLLVTCLCLIATQWAKKSTPEKQDQITKGFAWALVFNVLIWQAVKSYVSFLPENDPAYVKYNWGEDLPLNPCNWLAFVALAYSYTKKEWLWPIMYFFVWVGRVNDGLFDIVRADVHDMGFGMVEPDGRVKMGHGGVFLVGGAQA